MNTRIIPCLLVLMAATLSPAPIRDKIAAGHELRTHSQQEVTGEQRFNGNLPVVGEEVLKTNQDGTAPANVENDATAASAIATTAPVGSNVTAVQNLTRAEKALKLANDGGMSPWLMALIMCALGFGLFHGLRIWLEKNGPAPKTRTLSSSRE